MAYAANYPPVVAFIAGEHGAWQVDRVEAVKGETLAPAKRLDVVEDAQHAQGPAAWTLRGFLSNMRYATRAELDTLAARQQGLGRANATCAALIPIRKTDAWWALAQDERRAIFEEQSRHTAIGLEYLPAIARRLHHSRDLGEPFDFLTWFEYAPQHSEEFEALLARLRATKEWEYVDREVDIRLTRAR